MPLATPRAQSAPSNPPARLEWFGGRVVSNVSVHSVYYGTGSYQKDVGPNESGISGFFAGVTNSVHFDWLTEYNIPGQTIGRGSFRGKTTISPSLVNNAATIDDRNIQAELDAQLSSGGVPAPDLEAGGFVKTVYAIFLPQGKTITQGGATGGLPEGFCAYHSTILHNGLAVPYMVLPDFDDPTKLYDQGCGTDKVSLFNNFTSVTSHELIEVVTDPDVGLATPTDSSPVAWYDLNYAEIGDICAGQDGKVVGGNGILYTVQSEFSNAANDCILTLNPRYKPACRNSIASAFADAGLAADCLKLYGVALGKQDGSFGENDALFRSQVSSLLARLVQTATGNSMTQSRSFPDVTPDTVPNAQVRNEIELLAGSNIIAGFPDGLFHPAETLTVAQAATLVIRAVQFIHADRLGRDPATTAPDIRDQGSTSANYQHAINQGLLDPNAADLGGQNYTHQAVDGTKRGLLADVLAQALQRLVTDRIVAPR